MIQFKAKTTSGGIINSALSEFTFPAGEVHIKREERRDLEAVEIAVLYADQDLNKDFFMLQAWDNLIQHEAKGTYRVAVIPYFPGARADHNYPKTLDLYVGAIAATQIDEVVIFDPHSKATVEALKKLPELKVTVYYPTNALMQWNNRTIMPHIYSFVIAPDAGAVARADAVAKLLDVKLYTGTKVRNQETGKLTDFKMEKLPSQGRGLIVDDICDGGGTFAGLMEAVGPREGLMDLYVSHGVFSGKALELLPKYFDQVFTTNSYNPRRNLQFRTYGGRALTPDITFKRIDIVNHMLEKVDGKLVVAEPHVNLIPLGGKDSSTYRVVGATSRSAITGMYNVGNK